MLTVKTKIRTSLIAGIGLFSDQFISKGTIVWKFKPNFDILMTKAEIDTLSDSAQKQFYNYAYLDKKYGKYLLCFDDARFFNHALDPNCDDSFSDQTFALRDIQIGEELTVNYKDFYGDAQQLIEVL